LPAEHVTDDPRPDRLRDLDPGGADTGGAGVDQCPAATGEAALDDERVPGGEEDLGHRCGVDGGDRVRNGQRLAGVRDHLLGVAAAGLDAHRPITDRPAGHVGADRRDDACVFEAGDLQASPTRIGVHAHPLEDVGAIDGGVLDVDDDVVASRRRVVDLLDRQHFGATMGTKDHCAHLPEPIGSGRWWEARGLEDPPSGSRRSRYPKGYDRRRGEGP
jgi:hypothetical protein